MKRFAAMLVVLLLAALAVAAAAWAAAPVRAILATGVVLANLDESQPPNYPAQGWLDRQGLTLGVIEVIRVQITTPPGSGAAWCPPMQAIADNDRYFDANMNPNPARDAFARDWRRAMRNANCLTTP